MENNNNIINTNKELAFHKMLELASLFADCGITSSISENDEVLVLVAPVMNCIDGSVVNIEVGACDYSDYELEIVANPDPEAKWIELLEEETEEE